MPRKVDPKYFRPREVDTLLGDSTKARLELGWTPTIGVSEMAKEMVEADLKRAKTNRLISQTRL